MMQPPLWTEVTPSQYPWEREALTFIRARLPDHEPYRAWSNFELIAGDGSVNEVDLVVLTKKGFFLVEIKSRPGRVDGDASTWTWNQDGRRTTVDNPLLLANRKAKKLKSLLDSRRALKGMRLPFLEALVFLSAEGMQVSLPDNVRASVHLRDQPGTQGPEGRPARAGIVDALMLWPDDSPPRLRIDKPLAKALSRAMDQAGIRESQRARKISDYELDGLLYEGPHYQDWSATHVSLREDHCRVRLYVVEPGASEELRQSVERAARREYQILHGLAHEGILKARAYHAHERGPAVVFDHTPAAQRLDHFLADHGESLTVDQRLDILRQVAEAVRYAHGKRLVHRALSPQNLLVLNPGASDLRLQVFNWQTGARRPSTSGKTRLAVTATSHINDLIEEPSVVYMAPETLGGGEADEQSDVFSLGALAYRLFAGKAPAGGFFELMEKLRADRGLQISEVLDGAPEPLRDLVQYATHPDRTHRLESADDVLRGLDEYEDALTAPDTDAGLVDDPTVAGPHDRLPHGLTVKRRIGSGSTAVALLVERDGRELVLKIAREPSDSERVRAEGEVLESLQPHQHIVRLREMLEFGPRVGLLMDLAGGETLAERLREGGRLQLELLERFGEDLLNVVGYLEAQGIPHRDIKPDNLGVAPVGRGDALHLVLFDFSLSRTSTQNLLAGTRPYLDPFLGLRKPARWDDYAERFAVAITLYQMATNTLPVWGDGESEPALLEVEATLDAEAFEPALREPLLAFFTRALRRDYRERFDNAPDMLLAWRACFTGARAPEVGTGHGDQTLPVTPLEQATPGTLLAALGLSARGLNALERTALRTVEDLLRFPFSRLRRLRGVGSKTRRELAELLQALNRQFPDIAREPKHRPVGEREDEATAAEGELPPVEQLSARLLPARRSPGGADDYVSAFLGLPVDGHERRDWASQSEVARELGVNPATVSHALAKARRRWLKTSALTRIRDDIVQVLEAQGGVMTARELADALLAAHGSEQEEPYRSRAALTLLRAAIESERERANPRCIVRRARGGHCILVARDDLDEHGQPRIDGEKLADYAERLGETADQVAAQDPLPAPGRALEALQAVPRPPGAQALPGDRLLKLAVATARQAALSGRLELYPRGMPAQRVLKLSLNAISGAPQLSAEQIRQRVAGRYPEAEPLPDGPALGALLEEAGSELEWTPDVADGRGAYVAPLRDFTTVSSATVYARTPPVAPDFEPVAAEHASNRQFQRRLERSLHNGDFLVLATPPGGIRKARAALIERFPLTELSLEARLIRHMHEVVTELKASWNVVLAADAVPAGRRAASTDWRNLLRVVARAMPRLDAEICASAEPLLLTWPGLLARYGQLGYVNDLKNKTGRPGGPPALWMLVASDAQSVQPTVDGHPLPVFGAPQWARIPESWLLWSRAELAAESES